MDSISISQNMVKISWGGYEYIDTPANLAAHSDNVFTVLPAHIRQYMRKSSGQEYWIDESADTPAQVAPDLAYSAMIGNLIELLPDVVAAQQA